MIKTLIAAIVVMFSMVSIAVAGPAFGEDYITFNEGDRIRVDLLTVPDYDTYGMWDIMLYDFTDNGGVITANGEIDLFWDGDSFGTSIYLTVNNSVMNNGLTCGPSGDCYNSLVMTNPNLGIEFGFGDDDNYTGWYSHDSLNTGTVVDRFMIYEYDEFASMTVVSWFDDNDDIVGMIGLSHAPVPIPGAVWLLGSGLSLLALRKRN